MSDRTLLRYESDSTKIIPHVIKFLETRNVSSQARAYIEKTALAERTFHSTVNSEHRSFFEQRLRSSPYLMEKLYRMYYYDFKYFNYTIPPFVSENKSL